MVLKKGMTTLELLFFDQVVTDRCLGVTSIARQFTKARVKVRSCLNET